MKLLRKSPPRRRRKMPRGFIMVNMAAWQERQLRTLARSLGLEFRTFITHAISSYEEAQCAWLGLTWKELRTMSETEVAQLAERVHLARHVAMSSLPRNVAVN